MSGVKVTGCCTSTGLIASPSKVASEASKAANSVSDTVRDVGESLEAAQEKTTKTIDEHFKLQNKLLTDLFKGLGNANQKMESFKNYGPNSDSYIECDSSIGRQVAEGKVAEREMSKLIQSDLKEHSTTHNTSRPLYQRLLAQESEDINASYLFPQDSTLATEDVGKAKEMIKTVIDPFPPPTINDDLKDSSKGQDYEILRKIREARMSVPRAVMSDVVSAYSPTMELGSFAEEVKEKMGISDESMSYAKDGKVSPMAFLSLMTDMRFANPDWYQGPNGIHSKTTPGLLRELLIMNSVRMEMQRRQTKSLQYMSVMFAEQLADNVNNQFEPQMKRLRKQVLNKIID